MPISNSQTRGCQGLGLELLDVAVIVGPFAGGPEGDEKVGLTWIDRNLHPISHRLVLGLFLLYVKEIAHLKQPPTRGCRGLGLELLLVARGIVGPFAGGHVLGLPPLRY